MKLHDFHCRKVAAEKISMVTCYDYWSAQLLNESDMDTLLVGDSLAMVMHGFNSTVHATVSMMAMHIAAVRRGAPDKFIVGDMPFLAARRERGEVLDAVCELMQAGSNAIKIEGAAGQLDTIAHVVESGVPVIGMVVPSARMTEHSIANRSKICAVDYAVCLVSWQNATFS